MTASRDGRVFAAVTRGRDTSNADAASRSETLELVAFSQAGALLWSHTPKNPGGVFMLERITHHDGKLVVMGGLLNASRGAPWEIVTSAPDSGVVTWWDDTNGELERSYTFGGASKLGERVVETRQYTHDPCKSARPGTLRHVIGGPYICRPYYQSAMIGFVQRVELK